MSTKVELRSVLWNAYKSNLNPVDCRVVLVGPAANTAGFLKIQIEGRPWKPILKVMAKKKPFLITDPEPEVLHKGDEWVSALDEWLEQQVPAGHSIYLDSLFVRGKH